jgi:hypothetical protein
VKDIPNPDPALFSSDSFKQIIMLCEGAYGNNNADVAVWRQHQDEVQTNLYKTVNGKSLGDVAQHMIRVNNHYWITVNNSNKIVILDTATFREVHSIPSIPTPRFMCFDGNQTVTVGSLYHSNIYLINTANFQVEKTITLPYKNTETLLYSNGNFFAAPWDTASRFIFKFSSQLQVLTPIDIEAKAPHSMVFDKNGDLWVLCGNQYKNTPSYLVQLDTSSVSVKRKFAFSSKQDPIKLSINQRGDSLYYLMVNYMGGQTNNGLYCMNIDGTILPEIPLISAPTQSYYWAYQVAPEYNTIFLSDAKGFTQTLKYLSLV